MLKRFQLANVDAPVYIHPDTVRVISPHGTEEDATMIDVLLPSGRSSFYKVIGEPDAVASILWPEASKSDAKTPESKAA